MAKTKTWEDYVVLRSARQCNKLIDKIQNEIDNMGANSVVSVLSFMTDSAVAIAVGGVPGTVLGIALGSTGLSLGMAVSTQKKLLIKYRNKLQKTRDYFDSKQIESAVLYNKMVGTWDIKAHTYIIRVQDPVITTSNANIGIL